MKDITSKRSLHLLLCFVLMTIYTSLQASTACYFDNPGIKSAGFGSVTVQRDLPVGAEIARVTVNNFDYMWASTSSPCYSYMIMKYNGAIKSEINDTFVTNVPGVGIKFFDSDSAGQYYASPSPGTPMRGGKPFTFNGYYLNNGAIILVKTGNIISGQLNAGEVAQITVQEEDGMPGDNIQSIQLTSGDINQVACSVTSGNLSYAMGDIRADSFGDTVGTTPENAQVTQNLGLECDANANINVSLSGTSHPDLTTQSVLALTGQGNADVAKGVGVQIVYNGTPLELNKNIVLKKSAGGQETFPLTARYYQTKTKVQAGSANASATLNLTYQ